MTVSGSGTVKLNNSGNDYTGDTTVAAGSQARDRYGVDWFDCQ